MSRFFVPRGSIKGNKIHIAGEEAHHIIDVMRLKISDEVTVFDGTGKEYVGLVKTIDHKSLEVDVREIRNIQSGASLYVTLIQAIPKKDKMDYISEKATELGVSNIIPVTTARTIPCWNETKKSDVVKRWQRISLEAAKQCGRTDIPKISPIVSFSDYISQYNTLQPDTGPNLKLIAALSDNALKFKDALKGEGIKKVAIAIGPEGDFTPEEIDDAVRAGFKVVNLGPRVLKSDTAGLAALSIINYEYAS